MYNEKFWLFFNVYLKYIKIYFIYKMLLKLNLKEKNKIKLYF